MRINEWNYGLLAPRTTFLASEHRYKPIMHSPTSRRCQMQCGQKFIESS